MTKYQKTRRDHYQELTQQFIDLIKQKLEEYDAPFDRSKIIRPAYPFNAATGRHYSGVNTLLRFSKHVLITGDPRFCTYKQAEAKDWHVKEGEKSSARVYFFKMHEVPYRAGEKIPEGEEGQLKKIPYLDSFAVFHASQIEGIPAYEQPTIEKEPWRSPEAVDVILKNSGAAIRETPDKAAYSPTFDFIALPPRNSFVPDKRQYDVGRMENWAATALHELGHWTGHPSRLNRNLTGRFGDDAYAAGGIARRIRQRQHVQRPWPCLEPLQSCGLHEIMAQSLGKR